MKKEIFHWLTYDRNFNSGILLYFRFGKNRAYINIFNNQGKTQNNYDTLIEEFRKLLDMSIIDFNKLLKKPVKKMPKPKPEKVIVIGKNPIIKEKIQATPDAKEIVLQVKSEQKLRDEFPFFSQPDCPNELKILVADKITAFRAYKDSHEKLFVAGSPEQEFNAVRDTVENFILNREIYKELNYYLEHHKILGEHKMFDRIKKTEELQAMSTEKLVIKRDNLGKYILRKEKDIGKNDKPHLKKKRLVAIEDFQWELTEVKKIIDTRK